MEESSLIGIVDSEREFDRAIAGEARPLVQFGMRGRCDQAGHELLRRRERGIAVETQPPHHCPDIFREVGPPRVGGDLREPVEQDVALLDRHLAREVEACGPDQLDRAVDTLILDAKQRAHIDQRDHAVRGQIFAAERAVEDVDELLWRVGSGVGGAFDRTWQEAGGKMEASRNAAGSGSE